MSERFDQRSRIQAIFFRNLIELGHLGYENAVGKFQRLRQLGLKDCTSRCVGAGFENRPDAMAGITTAQGLQRLSDCSGMMSEIINDLHAPLFSAKLLAT